MKTATQLEMSAMTPQDAFGPAVERDPHLDGNLLRFRGGGNVSPLPAAIDNIVRSQIHSPAYALPMRWDSKHAGARKGKHGGSRIDRKDKRKRKIAEASRRRNRQ